MTSLITEQSETTGIVVLYDGACTFCTRWARRAERWLPKRGFRFAPLPVAGDEMKVVTTTGEMLGGADAAVYLARHMWWAWPVWAVSRLPGVMAVLRRGYRWVAANRYCVGGACHFGVRRLVGAVPVTTGKERQSGDKSPHSITEW